jgi:two-component system, sensor histidine kinase PdtaS
MFTTGTRKTWRLTSELNLGEKIKYLTYIATPYYDDQGKQIKQTGAVMDITERKLAEIKLEEAYIQIKERLSEKEVLIRELYHRTKNSMQVISSLLGLKAAANPSDQDVEIIFSDMQNRIKAIALVHEKLYQSANLSRVNLADYILDLAGLLLISHSVNPEKISFRHSLDEVYVLIDTAVPCGLIITELVLNTLKHAFPEDKEGYLEIKLKRHEDDRIELTISDNGIGLSEDELYNEEKIGLLIFRNIAENQLEAVVESDYSNGVTWSITFNDLLYKERV